MKCLWLTKQYTNPARSGDLIYTYGLMNSLKNAGADITAMTFRNESQPSNSKKIHVFSENGINWIITESNTKNSFLKSLFSMLPALAIGHRTRLFKKLLSSKIKSEKWDFIIIDSRAMGWTKKFIETKFKNRTKYVYISHNNESKLIKNLSTKIKYKFNFIKLLKKIDANKVAYLESYILKTCDLITTITEDDKKAVALKYNLSNTICLYPGYFGLKFPNRSITKETPRQVVICGSFNWKPKEENLLKFLKICYPKLNQEKISILVLGLIKNNLSSKLKILYPNITIAASVETISPFLLNSRLGLMIEELGGGFKLKALDYIFHSVPIAGIEDSFTGMPKSIKEASIITKDFHSLSEFIIKNIDNEEYLNKLKKTAFENNKNLFEWSERGLSLFKALKSLETL